MFDQVPSGLGTEFGSVFQSSGLDAPGVGKLKGHHSLRLLRSPLPVTNTSFSDDPARQVANGLDPSI